LGRGRIGSDRVPPNFRLVVVRDFLAVAGDFKIPKITNEWSDRDYEWDKKRASPPFCRRVFRPATVSASKLVFAAGADKDEAAGRAAGF